MKLISKAMGVWRKLFTSAIVSVNTRSPKVALTFDDGPHPVYTPAILDVLKKHDALATFFIVGKAAAENPAVLERAVSQGHELGNHSWNHISYTQLDPLALVSQIKRCAKYISSKKSKFLRPPFGHQSYLSSIIIKILGYKTICWNMHAEDWVDHDQAYIVERLHKLTKPGSIILMHDALFDNPPGNPMVNREVVIAALDEFLDKAKHEFEFVTLSELISAGKPRTLPWLRQHIS